MLDDMPCQIMTRKPKIDLHDRALSSGVCYLGDLWSRDHLVSQSPLCANTFSAVSKIQDGRHAAEKVTRRVRIDERGGEMVEYSEIRYNSLHSIIQQCLRLPFDFDKVETSNVP